MNQNNCLNFCLFVYRCNSHGDSTSRFINRSDWCISQQLVSSYIPTYHWTINTFGRWPTSVHCDHTEGSGHHVARVTRLYHRNLCSNSGNHQRFKICDIRCVHGKTNCIQYLWFSWVLTMCGFHLCLACLFISFEVKFLNFLISKSELHRNLE